MISKKNKHLMGIKVDIRYCGMCKLDTFDKYDCIGITVKN